MKKSAQTIERVLAHMGGLMRQFHMHKHRMPLFGEKTMGRAQIDILMMLTHRKKAPTMRELAKHLRVTSGAMTQIIAPLIKKNFVVKIQDEVDKRVTRITLTPTAVNLMQKAKHQYVKAMIPLFETLSQKDMTELERILRKLSQPYDDK